MVGGQGVTQVGKGGTWCHLGREGGGQGFTQVEKRGQGVTQVGKGGARVSLW
jgi:hypothetical protein